MSNPLPTFITFFPLLSAIMVLLPWGKWLDKDKAEEEKWIKNGAIILSLIPLLLAIVLWLQVALAWWPMLIGQDRARLVFPHPVGAWLVGTAVAVAGPVLAYLGLAALLL